MANFPGSLDALANPTAATLRNDPGFELHLVISTLNDIAELLEAKLGTGASTPGAAAAVLRRTGSGSSAWQQIQAGDYGAASIGVGDIAPGGQVNKRQLNYTAATDIANAVAVSTAVWVDVHTNQSFAVDDASSVVEIAVRGTVLVSSPTNGSQVGTRILLDGATGYFLGGGLMPAASAYLNGLSSAGIVALTGLSVGSHTVRVQAICSANAALYCRPATFPNYEGLSIVVMERKR
jgi:hypothetical protein